MSVVIDADQCMGCGNCMRWCPRGLLELSGEKDLNARGVRHVRLTDPEACVSCGRCELMCTAAALHVPGSKNGYDLLDNRCIPPHSGCSLGNLAKALADAIFELGIQEDVVLFKMRAADVNMHVESHDYEDGSFYEDGLAYKREHPEKVVVLICSSSKVHTTAENEERYRALADERVTIINTLNWFESDEGITELTAGGSRILEEVANGDHAGFVARAAVRDPKGVQHLKGLIKTALTRQMEGANFSLIEMVYPCYYRLAGRPQTLMPHEQLKSINAWFDEQVLPLYPAAILKQ